MNAELLTKGNHDNRNTQAHVLTRLCGNGARVLFGVVVDTGGAGGQRGGERVFHGKCVCGEFAPPRRFGPCRATAHPGPCVVVSTVAPSEPTRLPLWYGGLNKGLYCTCILGYGS